MSGRPAVVEESLKVNERLRDLGVSEDILLGAIRAGIGAAAACTGNHPPNYPGLALWAEAVKYLRDMLIPSGWSRSDTKNFSTVVNGERKIAIAVARGDSDTGDSEGIPSTQYPKGVATLQAVEQNLMLPFDDVSEQAREKDGPFSTWFLLHSRDGDTLVCELSHPTRINSSGYVEEWDERILLSSITLDPARIPVLDDEPVDSEVSIRRRDAI